MFIDFDQPVNPNYKDVIFLSDYTHSDGNSEMSLDSWLDIDK